MHQFLASVLSLVDASVSEYQRRGFKNLMVSFGCTGGQHRSVYLAEQLAKRLRGRNGVEVVVASSLNWRSSADEGDGSGCRPRHAPAAAHRRPPQGAGGSRRPHAAGNHARPPARASAFAKSSSTCITLRDMVLEYLKANNNFGMRIEVSREDDSARYRRRPEKSGHSSFCEGPSGEPFILHNVDVISTIDLARMVLIHRKQTRSPPWRCKNARLPAIFCSTSTPTLRPPT